jgi:hypothetical protein
MLKDINPNQNSNNKNQHAIVLGGSTAAKQYSKSQPSKR